MGEPKGGLLAGVLSALPLVGNVASLFLQRKWAKQDLAAQNAYNDPAQQAQRLRNAGFSPNMMYGGGSPGGQSQQPRETSVAPDLGTSDIHKKFTMNQIEKQQLALLQAQTRKENAEAGKAEGETDWLRSGLGQGANTNQTGILRTRFGIDQAHKIGADIANSINTEDLKILKTFGMRTAKAKYGNLVSDYRNKQQDLQTKKVDQQRKELALRIESKYGMSLEQAKLNNLLTDNEKKQLQLGIDKEYMRPMAEAGLNKLMNENARFAQAMTLLDQQIQDKEISLQIRRNIYDQLINGSKGTLKERIANIIAAFTMGQLHMPSGGMNIEYQRYD